MLQEVKEIIQTAIDSNQFFQGGFILMILGAILASLRKVPKYMWEFLKRRCTISVEIIDRRTVMWFTLWMSEHSYSRTTKKLLAILTSPNEDEDIKANKKEYKLKLSSGYGKHIFKHDGKWFWLERSRENMGGGSGESSLFQIERVTLMTWGRNKKAINNLIDSISEYVNDLLKGEITTFLFNGYGNWVSLGSLSPRYLNGLFFPNKLGQELTNDIDKFLNNKEWYLEMGIPYQRGYLLYGPPGNGKSSIIQAIAYHFQLPLYILLLSDKHLSDRNIAEAMARLPEKCILVFEDIDRVSTTIKQSNNDKDVENTLSMSGLLNAIDGPLSKSGRILFMTTNHPEKLDSVLTRSGRVDKKFEFPNATSDQAMKIFTKFFSDTSCQNRDTFGELLDKHDNISMADLQEVLLSATNEQEAIDNLSHKLLNEKSINDYHTNGKLETHKHENV